MATKDADWVGVSQALGRPGKLTDTVYRVPLVRSDLAVSSKVWPSSRGCRWVAMPRSLATPIPG